MFYCLNLVLVLKGSIPGVVVGRTWRLLMLLVMLFTVGYLATPFFPLLPTDVANLIVSLIFLFGAVYVVITVRLIYRIIEELSG
jgi:hypothetical protein